MLSAQRSTLVGIRVTAVQRGVCTPAVAARDEALLVQPVEPAAVPKAYGVVRPVASVRDAYGAVLVRRREAGGDALPLALGVVYRRLDHRLVVGPAGRPRYRPARDGEREASRGGEVRREDARPGGGDPQPGQAREAAGAGQPGEVELRPHQHAGPEGGRYRHGPRHTVVSEGRDVLRAVVEHAVRHGAELARLHGAVLVLRLPVNARWGVEDLADEAGGAGGPAGEGEAARAGARRGHRGDANGVEGQGG